MATSTPSWSVFSSVRPSSHLWSEVNWALSHTNGHGQLIKTSAKRRERGSNTAGGSSVVFFCLFVIQPRPAYIVVNCAFLVELVIWSNIKVIFVFESQKVLFPQLYNKKPLIANDGPGATCGPLRVTIRPAELKEIVLNLTNVLFPATQDTVTVFKEYNISCHLTMLASSQRKTGSILLCTVPTETRSVGTVQSSRAFKIWFVEQTLHVTRHFSFRRAHGASAPPVCEIKSQYLYISGVCS